MATRLLPAAVLLSLADALAPSSVSSFPSHVTPAPSYDLALALRQAAGQTDCDGQGIFTCPIGTCYTGVNSYVGCCSVSNCPARTTCLPYAMGGSSAVCDMQTGGCVVCSDVFLPTCMTISNEANGQFIMYCGTSTDVTLIATSYENLVASGSTAQLPTPSGTASGSSPTSSGVSGGEIGGIVAGAIVLIVAAIAGVYFYMRKRRADRPYPHTQFSPLENKPSPFADLAAFGRASGARDNDSFESSHAHRERAGLGISEVDGLTPGASRSASTRRSDSTFKQFHVVNPSPDPSSIAPSYTSSPSMGSALVGSGAGGAIVASELDSTPRDPGHHPTATGWQGYRWISPEAALAGGYNNEATPHSQGQVFEMGADNRRNTTTGPAELG